MFSIFDGSSELKRQLKQNRGLKRTETGPKEKEGVSSVIYETCFLSSCIVHAVFLWLSIAVLLHKPCHTNTDSSLYTSEEFQKCFQQREKRWHKFIESKGEYFEGDYICNSTKPNKPWKNYFRLFLGLPSYKWPPVAGNKDEKGSETWEGGKSVFATDNLFSFGLCPSTNFSISMAGRRSLVFPSSGKERTYAGGPLR